MPHIDRWNCKYGKSYFYWFGSQVRLVIREPELIKVVLNDKERIFAKLKPNDFGRKILGDGLGVSKGEKWAKMRKLANHAFQAENLKGMFQAMVESVEAMIKRWEVIGVGKEIEDFKEFTLLSSEVISRTAFGSSFLEGKVIFEKSDRFVLLVSRNWMKQMCLGIR